MTRKSESGRLEELQSLGDEIKRREKNGLAAGGCLFLIALLLFGGFIVAITSLGQPPEIVVAATVAFIGAVIVGCLGAIFFVLGTKLATISAVLIDGLEIGSRGDHEDDDVAET